MKLPVSCMKCPFDEQNPPVQYVTVAEVRDDGRYEVVCPRGHKTIILTQSQKFEVLFEIGAYAIADGYYREAVSSFTSSIERFHEFFVKIMLFEKKIDPTLIENGWKMIKSQSERQLGAFIFLYIGEFNRNPIILTENQKSFRNNVIHNGKIPSRKEAIEYGETILSHIRSFIADINHAYPNGIQNATVRHMVSRHRPDENAAVMALSTIIGLHVDDKDWHERSLAESIKKLRRWDNLK